MKALFETLGVILVLSCVPALVLFLRARRRLSGSRAVRCPETGYLASIHLDANRAAFSELSGDRDFHVKECSRWAGPVGHCFEQCLEEDGSRLSLARAQ
ncbi:MAG TPA: hypothetical protein VJA66_05630 [Thermoanaerobaculia bacterium]